MRVLLDTDVLLDFFLDRQPFVEAVTALFQAHEQGQFSGYVSAITPTNLSYIARRIGGKERAAEIVAAVLDTFVICPVDGAVLRAAQSHTIRDFEDAIQYVSAAASGVEAIVTRNLADFARATLPDFARATLPVFAPADFLDHLRRADQSTMSPADPTG